MRYFLIGDEVYVPKHKMIGTVTDKLYERGNDEVMLRVNPRERLSNIAYGNSMRYNPVYVDYSSVRSLKTTELYNKKIEMSFDVDGLNIPNLLKKKDIIKGTKIKVVDNYMLERMFTYEPGNHLYTKLILSYLVGQEGILTGKSIVLPNGVLSVECRFPMSTYYVYQHSLQLVKRVNLFRRIWGKIRKIDRRVWMVLFFLVSIAMLVITFSVLDKLGL